MLCLGWLINAATDFEIQKGETLVYRRDFVEPMIKKVRIASTPASP